MLCDPTKHRTGASTLAWRLGSREQKAQHFAQVATASARPRQKWQVSARHSRCAASAQAHRPPTPLREVSHGRLALHAVQDVLRDQSESDTPVRPCNTDGEHDHVVRWDLHRRLDVVQDRLHRALEQVVVRHLVRDLVVVLESGI